MKKLDLSQTIDILGQAIGMLALKVGND